MLKENWQRRITLVGFLDSTTPCSGTPMDLDATCATEKLRAIMPDRRIAANVTAHVNRGSRVKAKQQTSKGTPPRLARVLDASWKGVYAVELTNEQRDKEKEMLKSPPKSTPSKGKSKDNDKDGNGGKTATK